MSQRNQQNDWGMTPMKEQLLRRRVSRRTVLRTGASSAAGFAAAGALARTGTAATIGGTLRTAKPLG